MDLQLGGKIAFVIGSTAGIGLAIASRLARESAEIVINGRTGIFEPKPFEKIADADWANANRIIFFME